MLNLAGSQIEFMAWWAREHGEVNEQTDRNGNHASGMVKESNGIHITYNKEICIDFILSGPVKGAAFSLWETTINSFEASTIRKKQRKVSYILVKGVSSRRVLLSVKWKVLSLSLSRRCSISFALTLTHCHLTNVSNPSYHFFKSSRLSSKAVLNCLGVLMTLPNPGAAEVDISNVTLLNSSSSLNMDAICANGMGWTEKNYLSLSDSPSVDKVDANMNLKATELRLGLPGSQSPDRSQLEEKPFFPLHPTCAMPHLSSPKHVVSGNKRGFSDAMEEGKFSANAEGNTKLCSVLESKGNQLPQPKDVKSQKSLAGKEIGASHNLSTTGGTAPAAKAQVVGWPPLPQFRKNSFASTPKTSDEVDVSGASTLFVKVSMDGAPYQRKVDLRKYSSYQSLSSALEKMFSCFTIGQYVLAYEDEVGDLMRVGDVPWEMFIEICKKLKITKSSSESELAPRAVEQCMFKA